MPKCTILIGVPASGKSTWLVNNMSLEAWVVSTDMIIEGLANDYGFTYNEIFSETIRFAEKVMWANIKMAAEEGQSMYIDRTNISEKSRKKFIDFLKPYGYTFEAVDFETPEDDDWERRLASRQGKTIPNHVLESMADNYEMPLKSEGFENITFIKNNG
jgi:predicted kinase